jgi:2-oxoglutarate ferredoxin oxidoreductase subunit gamma
LVDDEPELDDSIDIVRIPADDIAVELGSPRSTNMIMLGAYLTKKRLFSIDAAAQALPAVLAKRYHVTIPVNIKALQLGSDFVTKNGG